MATPITVYASIADMDAAINSSALAGVETIRKQRSLEDASGEMNSYLPAQYVLPLTQVGPNMRRHCTSIAIWLALGGRGFNPEAGGDQFIEKMYDRAIDWLKGVAKGIVTPDITDSRVAVGGVPHTDPIVISSSSRGFTDRGTSDRQPFQGD